MKNTKRDVEYDKDNQVIESDQMHAICNDLMANCDLPAMNSHSEDGEGDIDVVTGAAIEGIKDILENLDFTPYKGHDREDINFALETLEYAFTAGSMVLTITTNKEQVA